MEEKEASATSNSTSPRGRKAFMLGVVNASEIKCTGDRKRRWDQPPGESEGEEPLAKMPCEDASEYGDSLLENNVRHNDNPLHSSTDPIPIPSASQLDDRLASPSTLSQTLVVKEQIVVQTPSEVLNNLGINSTFPTTITSSFNELNYSEGNQKVTIEIETVAVTPSSCDDESKSSIEVVNPNSATIDSKSNNERSSTKVEMVNCNVETSLENASSPLDSEGYDTMDRGSIDVVAAGKIDPNVMEVILGISPSKTTVPTDSPESEANVANPDFGAEVSRKENLNIKEEEAHVQIECDKVSDESVETKLDKSDKSCKSEPHLTKVGARLKALVDYDDFSDESSQQSDKVLTAEPLSKNSAEESTAICENSLDSKEEEFHDCIEHPITDESNCDSTSLNFAPIAQETDDLINNNPSDNDGTYSEGSRKDTMVSGEVKDTCLMRTTLSDTESNKLDNIVETDQPGLIPASSSVAQKDSALTEETSINELGSSEILLQDNLNPSIIVSERADISKPDSDKVHFIAEPCDNKNKVESQQSLTDSSSNSSNVPGNVSISFDNEKALQSTALESTSQILPSSESQSESTYSDDKLATVEKNEIDLAQPEKETKTRQLLSESTEHLKRLSPSDELAIKLTESSLDNVEPCDSSSAQVLSSVEESGKVLQTSAAMDSNQSPTEYESSRQALSLEPKELIKAESVQELSALPDVITTSPVQVVSDELSKHEELGDIAVKSTSSESLEASKSDIKSSVGDGSEGEESVLPKLSAKQHVGENKENINTETTKISSKPLDSSESIEANALPSSPKELDLIGIEEISKESKQDSGNNGFTSESVSLQPKKHEVLIAENSVDLDGNKEILNETSSPLIEAKDSINTLSESLSTSSFDSSAKGDKVESLHLNAVGDSEAPSKSSGNGIVERQSIDSSDIKKNTEISFDKKEVTSLKEEAKEEKYVTSNVDCFKMVSESTAEEVTATLSQKETIPLPLTDKTVTAGLINSADDSDKDIAVEKPIIENAVAKEAVNKTESMEVDENSEDKNIGKTNQSSPIENKLGVSGISVASQPSNYESENIVSEHKLAEGSEEEAEVKSQRQNVIASEVKLLDVSNEKVSQKIVASNPAISENNSVLSSVDLNMECESVDTVQSMESEASLLPAKEDVEMVNSNSVIDVSSDSSSSQKKDKTALTFDLSKINNSKKDSEVSINKFGSKTSSVIPLDDDNLYVEPVHKLKQDKVNVGKNNKSDVILVPDSDSSSSNTGSMLNAEKSKNTDNLSFLQVKIDQESSPSASLDDSVDDVSLNTKLSSRNEVCKAEINKNAVIRKTRSIGSSETQIPETKQPDSTTLLNSVSSSSDSPEVVTLSNAIEEVNDEDDGKNEPITLRIFKDNNALHSESKESPKRPRLDDSPKQLEFTLKISKDASTNIPKATMSPKRTQSPQRLPEPVLPRISSEVSITPIVSPPQTEKKTAPMPMRHISANDASAIETSIEISLTKMDNINRVSSVVSHVNNVSEIAKTDLSNCNNVRSDSGDKSIIEIKDEISMKMESPVNISVRGRRGRGRGELHLTPGPPRRRGRPPKRPVPEYVPMGEIDYGTPGFYSPGIMSSPGTPTDNSASSRPVRECRDRTRPIIFKTRKPRGGGTPRGRGGRGGARIPTIPGREALSVREQEELARIEARNQQIRLEKLAKREAKLAKLAKKAKKSMPEEPQPPPRELTEEEKIELAAKREAEEKAAAEARAIAAREAERRAAEAAAAKELEKLAKIAARKERLRELHRMKREKILAKKAAKKLKDEERRKRKAAEKAAEQAAALQSMYEDETRMSAPDGSLRPLFGDDTPNRNKTGRMEINLSESKEVSVEQLAEYQWENGELYMIQEQVAEYLGVKSFKRKYPELRRRPVDAEERKYLEDTCLVPKSLCDLGITAVSSAEVLDIMFQDFPDKYEEVRRYLREKQMKEISSKQRALSLYSKQSDKAKADLREQAMECAATWNAHLNRERREERKCSMDLQSFIIHYPLSKRETMKQTLPPPGNYPVAVLPGQFCDYYKKYTSNELMYFPLNTVLYGPLKPNERRLFHSDASQSDSESSSSSSSESSSSSDDSGSESEGDEDTKCKICSTSRISRPDEGGGKTLLPPAPNKPEIFLPCTKCKQYCHPSCCNITSVMLPYVRKYNWVCLTCKVCVKCNSGDSHSKMRLCDLCDRGFHITCLDPRKMVPEGNRWHCAVCSFCWSCGAREPGGPSNQWLHEFLKDESGDKVYQRSLCAACCVKVGRDAAAAVAAAAAAASSQQAGPSGIKLGTSTVTTSGTMTPPVGTIASSSSTPTTPIRAYQTPQIKDSSQVRFSNPHVRLALSQTLNSMVVRSVLRGAGSDSLVVRTGPRLPSSPDSVVVRANRSTETQVVVRTPGVIPRPRQPVAISPNNRLETLSPPPSININAATNTPKK